jgi:hypothetical protein
MGNCKTVEELAQMTYLNLHVMSPRDKSAFWTILSKLLQNRGGRPSRTNHNKHGQIKEQLDVILVNTLENIGRFNPRAVATTALGLAKIVKQVGHVSGKRSSSSGSPHQILHDLLIGIDSEHKQSIFSKIAISSIPIIHELDPRNLSNYIYAFGVAECVPNVKEGRTLFDVIALQAIPKLRHFNSQDLSNMLWAYANVGAQNSLLFKAAGDSIVPLENLRDFWPQALSNITWAYATAGKSHPRLFKKLANHVVALENLNGFKPQEMSNIVWAYATAGESHPRLFEKLADHVVALDDLRDFWPQALSNIMWSYATAGEAHPRLFETSPIVSPRLPKPRMGSSHRKFPTSYGRTQLWARHTHGYSNASRTVSSH